MTYRRDVDGLRAVAVTAVVLYHAGIKQIRGGFTGVDIFFVISGFLITTILVNDIRADQFSLAKFYQRRILRILPALTAVLVVVSVAAALLLFPNELRKYGSSLCASSLFYSNYYFWSTTNYFDSQAELKPLIHTWSLAVEEQFYIFYPLALFAFYKFFKGRFALGIATLALVSFVVSVYLTHSRVPSSFYLLPSRFWELAVGGLIAVGGAPKIASPTAKNWVVIVGALLVAVAVLRIQNMNMFPGPNALFPCIGATIIIAYGEGTVVGRVLGTKPMVAIGLISYSLYLWHWPCFVFARIISGGVFSHLDAAIALAFAVGASVFSFYLIEQPFRTAKFRQLPSLKVLPWGVAAIGCIAFGGVVLTTLKNGLGQFPPDVLSIVSFTEQKGGSSPCCITPNSSWRVFEGAQAECLPILTNKKNYLVMGDSHANDLWKALTEVYPDASISQAAVSSCKPVLGREGDENCEKVMDLMFNTFIPRAHYDAIFLSSRWSRDTAAKLPQTLDYLSKFARKVIVLGPRAEYEWPLPLTIGWNKERGRKMSTAQMLSGQKELDKYVEKVVTGKKAIYISSYKLLCPTENEVDCQTLTPEGDPLLYDRDHFTTPGAKYFAQRIKQLIPDP